MSAPAAWYGKLPALGDFASRRLDASFIEPWDAWLAAGLAAWRAADDGWLQHYLAGPSWRFLLEPGALAKRSPALAGVLMPSVDNVGRYFPLTLVQPLQTLPASAADWQALLSWLHRLDDVAVDALHDDWPLGQLEDELLQLGQPDRPDGNDGSDINDGHGGNASLPAWAEPLAHAARQPRHRSWWWCADAHGAPQLFQTTGLPLHPTFASMLTGELHALNSALRVAD